MGCFSGCTQKADPSSSSNPCLQYHSQSLPASLAHEFLVEGMRDAIDGKFSLRQSKLFLKVIEGLEVGPEIDSELFLALVDKVIVGDGLTFTLKNGEERTVVGSGD